MKSYEWRSPFGFPAFRLRRQAKIQRAPIARMTAPTAAIEIPTVCSVVRPADPAEVLVGTVDPVAIGELVIDVPEENIEEPEGDVVSTAEVEV